MACRQEDVGPSTYKMPTTPPVLSSEKSTVKGWPDANFSNLLDLIAATTTLQPSGPYILAPKRGKPVTFYMPLLQVEM